MRDQQPVPPGWDPEPAGAGRQREASGQHGTGTPALPVGTAKSRSPRWLVPVVACLVLGVVAAAVAAVVAWGPTRDELSTVPERSTTTEERATAAGPVVGTQEDPVPLGETLPGEEWELTVVGFEAGVDQAVADLDPSAEAAPEGQQYVRLRLHATFVGLSGPGLPTNISVRLVGASGRVYEEEFVEQGSAGEGEILSQQPEVFTFSDVEGFTYYLMDDADAEGPVLGFQPNVEYEGVPDGLVYFRVN